MILDEMTATQRRAAAFLIACLLGSAAEQSIERVYPINAATPRDVEEIAGVIRQVGQISEVSADTGNRTVRLRGTVGEVALAEWLIGQLDAPAGRPPLAGEYRAAAGADDVVRVFRLTADTTEPSRDLQEMSTLVRVMVDVKPVYSFITQRAIVARGTAEQMQAAGWLIDALDEPAGQPPRAAASPEYRAEHAPDNVLGVFYLAKARTSRDLMDVSMAMRTVAWIRWAFMFDSRNALVLRGTADQLALAEWLVAELDGASPEAATHEYWAPDPHQSNLVRVFHLKTTITEPNRAEVFSLIHTQAHIMDLAVCGEANAVVARGTSAQIALAGQLIKEWDRPRSPQAAR
jgi:hypothetical protein